MAPMIYHLTGRDEWVAARRSGTYTAPSLASEGFIHFSTAEQVAESARRHQAGRTDLVQLAVDAAALGDALKWEPSRGGALFPHLYGPLPVGAVAHATELPGPPEQVELPLAAPEKPVRPDSMAPRWVQRLATLERTVASLGEAVARGVDSLNELEQAGMVQRYELAFDSGWKTLEEYLLHEGFDALYLAPGEVIEAAAASRLHVDQQVWTEMLALRKALADCEIIDATPAHLRAIADRCHPALESMSRRLRTEAG